MSNSDIWMELINANRKNNINKENCFKIKPILDGADSHSGNWTDRAIKIEAFSKCWGICVTSIAEKLKETQSKIASSLLTTDIVHLKEKKKKVHINTNSTTNYIAQDFTKINGTETEIRFPFDPNYFATKMTFSQSNLKSFMGQISDFGSYFIPKVSDTKKYDNQFKFGKENEKFINFCKRNKNYKKLKEESKQFLHIKKNYNLIYICDHKNLIMSSNYLLDFNKTFNEGENYDNISRLLDTEDEVMQYYFNENGLNNSLNTESIFVSEYDKSREINNSISSNKMNVKQIKETQYTQIKNNFQNDLIDEDIDFSMENNIQAESNVKNVMLNEFDAITYVDDKWQYKQDNALQQAKPKKKTRKKPIKKSNFEYNLDYDEWIKDYKNKKLFNGFTNNVFNKALKKFDYALWDLDFEENDQNNTQIVSFLNSHSNNHNNYEIIKESVFFECFQLENVKKIKDYETENDESQELYLSLKNENKKQQMGDVEYDYHEFITDSALPAYFSNNDEGSQIKKFYMTQLMSNNHKSIRGNTRTNKTKIDQTNQLNVKKDFIRVDMKKVRNLLQDKLTLIFDAKPNAKVDFKRIHEYLQQVIPGLSLNSLFVALLQECNKNYWKLSDYNGIRYVYREKSD